MKSDYTKMSVTLNGEEVDVFKVDPDQNGNPRYVVHFFALGVQLKDYGYIPGLTKYRAKWYGGGYVFQSYNIREDLEWAADKVKAYYKHVGLKSLEEAQNMTDDELLNALQE